jgi:Mg-chelatase subunit ChlD
VKHLPDHGLESGQIQLGIASFYVQARGELPLDSLRQKDAILDTISSIKHTGGSTFIANGLKLAIEMVRKRTRPSAQLAIILISDG